MSSKFLRIIKTVSQFGCKKKNGIMKTFSILFYIFVLISIIILCVLLSVSYYSNVNLSLWLKILTLIPLTLPFLIIIVIFFRNLKFKKLQDSILTITLTNYLALLVFASGGIVAFEYLKKDQNKLLTPDLPPGTVGFRSWNAEVEIKNIEIYYQDTSNSWIKIPPEVINDTGNWIGPFKPNIEGDSRICIKKSANEADGEKPVLILKNCAICFFPKNSHQDLFLAQNVQVKSTVVFIKEPGSNYANPGFNIGFRIDTSKYPYLADIVTIIDSDSNTSSIAYNNSDPCIEFAFPYHDAPHLWIPGLDWKPAVLKLSNADDLERVRHIGKKKQIGDEYKLSAFIFNGNLSFNAQLESYKGSSVLLEAVIGK